MKSKGWGVWKVGAGKYVSGWPDYFAYHPIHGHRWIEAKSTTGKLTPSQKKRFTQMSKYGESIFVLVGRPDYYKLFKEPNWRAYR